MNLSQILVAVLLLVAGLVWGGWAGFAWGRRPTREQLADRIELYRYRKAAMRRAAERDALTVEFQRRHAAQDVDTTEMYLSRDEPWGIE